MTDNEPMLQAALDHAAASGGGTVYLPEGNYGIARPLIVHSGTHLVGDGPGLTVLRGLVRNWGKYAEGANVIAAVAMVAADSSSVRDLTVDLSFANTQSNGVALMPAGADYMGTPSTHCEVSNVEVIGGGDYHAYMIWNLRGRDIRIVNNHIDGRVAKYVPGSSQEGIESYGGEDVLVGWNDIRNIGNAALNFGSAGLGDTTIDGLEVVGNTVTNAGIGLSIGTSMGSAGPQNVLNVSIDGNDFTNLWLTGMYVPVQAHTEMRGLHITNNHLRNIGTEQTSGTGFFLQTDAADAETASATSDNLLQGNSVQSVSGATGTGVLVDRFPNLLVQQNTIEDIGNTGVLAVSAIELTLQGNSIANVGIYALQSYGTPSSIHVRDNTFKTWNRRSLPVAGVSIQDVSFGDVRGNTFQPTTLDLSIVRVEANAANVAVFGNVVMTPDGSSLAFAFGVTLFVNNSSGNSNLGRPAMPRSRR